MIVMNRGGQEYEMEKVAEKIVNCLDKEHTMWDDVDRMRMMLGIEIFLHNILMIGSILIFSRCLNIFWEACVLLAGYGVLKIKAGGIHMKSSLGCMIATGTFILAGVFVARRLEFDMSIIAIIYVICLIILMVLGPQGTINHPILYDRQKKLKIQICFIVCGYLGCSFFTYRAIPLISYILVVALIFETISIIPLHIKNRQY